jgi:hypothetical protein
LLPNDDLDHRAELDAVQMDRRRHAEMIAAEYLQAALELFLGNIERDVANRPVGAANIAFSDPAMFAPELPCRNGR